VKLFNTRRIIDNNGIQWWHISEREGQDVVGTSNSWRYFQTEEGLMATKIGNGTIEYKNSEDFNLLTRDAPVIGDYYRNDVGTLFKLIEIEDSLYSLEQLGTDNVSRITNLELYDFVATNDYEEFEVIDANRLEVGDIVKVKQVGHEYCTKFVEVESFPSNSMVRVNPYNDMRPWKQKVVLKKNVVTVIKRKMPEMKAFSEILDNTNTPRVKCSLRNTTHVIPNNLRTYPAVSPELLRLRLNGRNGAYDFKRYEHGGWFIDLIINDITAARGSVVKTFYRAFDPMAVATEQRVEGFLRIAGTYDARVEHTPTVEQTTTAQTITPEMVQRTVSAVEALNRTGNVPQGGDGEIPVTPLTPEQLNTMFNTAPPRPQEPIVSGIPRYSDANSPDFPRYPNADTPGSQRRRNQQRQQRENRPDEGIWAHHRKKL
jgi:hypothetical protein